MKISDTKMCPKFKAIHSLKNITYKIKKNKKKTLYFLKSKPYKK